jgi:hypothetical protein
MEHPSSALVQQHVSQGASQSHIPQRPLKTKVSGSSNDMQFASITEKQAATIGIDNPLLGPLLKMNQQILSAGNCSSSSEQSEDGGSSSTKKGACHFPWRVHQMLLDSEIQGNESIVSWLPDGKAFRVNNDKKDEFVSKISKLVLPSAVLSMCVFHASFLSCACHLHLSFLCC